MTDDPLDPWKSLASDLGVDSNAEATQQPAPSTAKPTFQSAPSEHAPPKKAPPGWAALASEFGIELPPDKMADDAPPQCAVRKDPVAELLGFPPPSAKPPEQDDAKSRMVREDEEEFEARQEDRDEIDPRWDRGDSYRDEGRDFDDTAGAVEDRLEEDRIVDRDDSGASLAACRARKIAPFGAVGAAVDAVAAEGVDAATTAASDLAADIPRLVTRANRPVKSSKKEISRPNRPKLPAPIGLATPSSATTTTAISADAAAGSARAGVSHVGRARRESRVDAAARTAERSGRRASGIACSFKPWRLRLRRRFRGVRSYRSIGRCRIRTSGSGLYRFARRDGRRRGARRKARQRFGARHSDVERSRGHDR